MEKICYSIIVIRLSEKLGHLEFSEELKIYILTYD